ncbi:MAG: NADH-quinone oxidoreductase subunit L, partial [Flavisolibacter sp.]
YWTFLVGCLAIAGIVPFSGFFSKDSILLAAFEQGKSNGIYYVLYGVGLLTATLTAFYMFRLLFITFFGGFRGTDEQKHHVHESPAAMTIPLIVLAILAVVGGFINVPAIFTKGGERLTEFLSPVVPNVESTVGGSMEWMLMGLTTVIAVVAILVAWRRYKTYREEQPTALGKFLENKWYVDELYDSIIVKPLNALGSFANSTLEKSGIDALVNGVGRAVNYSGRQLRWLQSGQVGSYVLLMVVSMVIFFVLEFFLKK